MEPQSNTEALRAFLAPLADPDPALVALAFTLAQKLDDGAGLATAAVSKEYRATLDALRPTGDTDDRAFADWLAEMSAPLVDPAN